MKHLILLLIFFGLSVFCFGAAFSGILHNIMTELWFWYGRLNYVFAGLGFIFFIPVPFLYIMVRRKLLGIELSKKIDEIKVD